jgi:hypothetical protein
VKRSTLLLCAAAAAALSNGCDPAFSALTAPPPGATAELDDAADTIALTQGVALGFSCTYQGAPCDGAEASIDDASVATVQPAYVDLLAPDYRAGDRPRVVFVVVGKRPGETTLSVAYDGSDYALTVTVEPR